MCKSTLRDHRTVQRHQAAETAMVSNTFDENIHDVNPGESSTLNSHHNDDDLLLDEDDFPNISEQEDEQFSIPSDHITNYILGELHTKLIYGYSQSQLEEHLANASRLIGTS